MSPHPCYAGQINDPVKTAKTELARSSFALVVQIASILISIGLIAVIAYCAYEAQWTAAIFFLLVRAGIVKFLDSTIQRIEGTKS